MAAIASASALVASRIMEGTVPPTASMLQLNREIASIEIFDRMRKPIMDLDQIAAFERVVREGSFSRAAVALGIGQPAVSSRIQALEEDVGGILFLRGRRVSLTPMGEGLLPYARRVLEVLRE